jgi:poly(3-hydroxyalkanoate) depolymerase
MKTEMLDINGQLIRTAVWKGSRQHRPILFFNGIGANLELVTPLAEAMDRGDFIAFDVPGIGKSPVAKFPYRPWWIAKLAARILDQLGYDEVDVIGVSWGGGMAQQFAIQYPKRAKNLILMATSAGFTMVPGKPKALMKMASPKRYIDPDYLMKNFETLYGEVGEHAADHAIKITPPSQAGYFMQMGAMLGWTSLPFLPFLKQPTLILAGDRDSIVPLANAKILKAFIPKSKLHVVEDAGHLFIVSRAHEIIPIIGDFIGEWEDPGLSAAMA